MLNKNISSILSPVPGIIFMLFILAAIWGCSEEVKTTETLEVSTLNPVAPAAGGTVSLNITSNATWKVGKIDVAWLKVETETGTGNGRLLLSCDENATVQSRTAEFFIVTTRDGKYYKIELTQLATDPFIELEQNDIEVGSRPRSHEIKLNSNVPPGGISAEIQYEQEEGDNWVVGINVETDALKFQTVLNPLQQERVATIILSYTDISGEETEVWDKVTITQMASGNEPPPEVADFSYVKELPLGEIVDNIYIEGNIVSTGISHNFRQGTYIIQDDNNSAIAFEAVENLSLNKYDKVHLLLDGTQIETFEDCGMHYRVIRGINAANILKSEPDVNFSPTIMNISDLTQDHLLAMVTLKDVEFAMPHGGYANFHEYYITQSYADYATKHYPTPIRDIEGDDIYLITNREVPYRRNSVPKGSGTVTGLVVKMTDSAYGDLGTYSIRHLEESGITINPNQVNGFSEILVEWEFPDLSALQSTLPAANTAPGNPGHPFLPPTEGLSTATLKKHESSGIYAGYTASGGTYLIDKYRGDKPMANNSIIARGAYNVNNWGSGKYWIIDDVSTLGITSSLSLQFEANSVAVHGPRDFAVEYSLDGDNWMRIATYQVLGQMTTTPADQVQSVPSSRIYTFHLPDELLNKPKIQIRLMNISNTSVTGGNIQVPSSTSRLGYFSIKYNK